MTKLETMSETAIAELRAKLRVDEQPEFDTAIADGRDHWIAWWNARTPGRTRELDPDDCLFRPEHFDGGVQTRARAYRGRNCLDKQVVRLELGRGKNASIVIITLEAAVVLRNELVGMTRGR